MTQRLMYVGPSEILDASRDIPPGQCICVPDDLGRWFMAHRIKPDPWGHYAATYVVDEDGWLCLAPRRSEHVACAGGAPVLAAGEIFFAHDDVDGALYVVEISNQSTGYCPPLSSWEAVGKALDRVPLGHPGAFTRPFVFRRCPSCKARNLVKDDWFVCDICGADLPESWNFPAPG